MTDFDTTKRTNSNQNPTTGSSQNLDAKMANAGAEVNQRSGDTLRGSSDVVRDKFKEATRAAKDVASGAVDQIEGQAREQQRTSADFIERLASNIREAARAFESDVPFAARGINSAAEYVDDAAEKLHNGSLRDLVDSATNFAKRQPAAFLGISVLAGFAAVRFLRASGAQSSSSQRMDSENTSWARGEVRSQNESPTGSTLSRQGFSRPENSWEPASSSQGSNQ
jgi:gas vesicle protein